MILNNVDNSSNIDSVFEVIHEVKNSIAVCRGYLDIIDYDRECDMSKYISIMKEEFSRSMNIIGEFMQCGKFIVCKNIIDVNELVNDVCCNIGKFVKSKKILFEYDILEKSIYMNGDYDKLKQVFINLIKNGVEATEKDDGIINVFGYVDGDFYYTVIKDSGCGMEDSVLKKIMEGGFTTKLDGNGIGVKFCQKIILEHNGSIEYESVVGSGTKVIVKLPIVVV